MIYDSIKIKIQTSALLDNPDKIYLKIIGEGNNQAKTLKKTTELFDEFEGDKTSKIKNGIREYSYNIEELLIEKDQLQAIAKSIVDEYQDGRKYVETEWTGNPQLELGNTFKTCAPERKIDSNVDISKQEQNTLTNYTALSNEIKLESGFRMKTKARAAEVNN